MAYPMTRKIPLLHPHDRLSRAEFERRYAAMDASQKAELLNGAVFVASPVRHTYHGRPHSTLAIWLGFYVKETPGLDLGDNSSLRLPGDNEPQPDVLLRIPEERGGSSRIDPEGYVEGPPELIGEIAASSASYDLHEKLDVYRVQGVAEYVVHRVEDGAVDWFVLRGGCYERLAADPAGMLRSTVFPGLWLDVPALLRGDLRGLWSCVERGVADPSHAAFAARVRP